jgi:hypothetical protein
MRRVNVLKLLENPRSFYSVFCAPRHKAPPFNHAQLSNQQFILGQRGKRSIPLFLQNECIVLLIVKQARATLSVVFFTFVARAEPSNDASHSFSTILGFALCSDEFVISTCNFRTNKRALHQRASDADVSSKQQCCPMRVCVERAVECELFFLASCGGRRPRLCAR